MGNFQKLAEQVLMRSALNSNIRPLNQEAVSSFPPLAKETGNFWPKRENLRGNSKETGSCTSQASIGFHVETIEETVSKPLGNNQETFTSQNIPESFLTSPSDILAGHNVSSALDGFINGVNQLNIQLLPDDERWLKNICFGVKLHDLKLILEKYINHWIAAMAKEKTEYRKQNAGRLAANTFIREELIKSLVNI